MYTYFGGLTSGDAAAIVKLDSIRVERKAYALVNR
jgi:hypothetical protein